MQNDHDSPPDGKLGHALAGVGQEVALLDEAAVTDGQADPGNRLGHGNHAAVRGGGYGLGRQHERDRQRREDYADGAGVDLRLVRVGAVAAIAAAGTAMIGIRRAVQAWVARSATIVLPTVVRRMLVVVVRGCSLHGDVAVMRHHARHDRGLQPSGTKQPQHPPCEGSLPPSYPCQPEHHLRVHSPAIGAPYPHVTANSKH